jgi:UDP-3-O-[3-hydroxymyristoyl] glucosamine N-acyltransferase
MITYRLIDLAEHIRAVLRGDPNRIITSAGGLEDVATDGITYAEDERRLRQALSTPTAAVVVHPNLVANLESDKAFLLHPQPRLAFAELLALFSPFVQPEPGIHETAVVGEGVKMGQDVSILPYSVIGNRVKLGSRVRVYPYTYIGDEAEIGDDTIFYPQVVIMPRTQIGNRVIVHPGTIIGGEGYAYVQHEGKHHKIPQIGRVVIEDEVEIGCNTTIDRAMTGETRIGTGTKIDNLVQVAHNVQVGAHCLLVSQVGIAGSSVLEDYVVLAGQVGVKDHIKIGQGAVVGAQGGVTKNLPPGGVYWGTPILPHRDLLHILSHYHKLPQLVERIQALEKKLAEMERE